MSRARCDALTQLERVYEDGRTIEVQVPLKDFARGGEALKRGAEVVLHDHAGNEVSAVVRSIVVVVAADLSTFHNPRSDGAQGEML